MIDILILKNLSKDSKKTLEKLLIQRKYEKDTIVCLEGHISDELFLIAEGSVDVIKSETKIGELNAGDCFGEIGIIDDLERSASIIANTDSIIFALSRDNFENFRKKDIEGYSTLLKNITVDICKKLRDLDGRLQRLYVGYLKMSIE